METDGHPSIPLTQNNCPLWQFPSYFSTVFQVLKNLILAEFVKRLELPTTPHPQPYNIGWLIQGRGIRITQQCLLPYGIKPFKYEVLCDVAPLEVCDVLLGQP